MHKIVEKEAESTKEIAEKAKQLRDMQKTQMQAYGKVVRENFKPKVSEILRVQLMQRESQTRQKEKRLREIREQGYRDYLIEQRRSRIITTVNQDESGAGSITPKTN
jgi:hypothetical protein